MMVMTALLIIVMYVSKRKCTDSASLRETKDASSRTCIIQCFITNERTRNQAPAPIDKCSASYCLEHAEPDNLQLSHF